MASFIVYDLVFLALFTLGVILFFKKNKENVKRHGWMFLYHSKFGLKFIDWTSKKFAWLLRPAQYVVITSGYILMAAVVWLLSVSAWRYVTSQIPEQLASVPPVAPLIPYFPRLFNLESFFPPLFFTYFLVALAVVALSHEFAHGIYARFYKIKVKTTGLAFLGPFFGAFVEPDEKQMGRKSKKAQLTILAAGTFANVVMAVIFVAVIGGFFAASYQPAGVNFNTYSQNIIELSDITDVNGNTVFNTDDILGFLGEEDFNEINAQNTKYLATSESLTRAVESEAEQLIVFDDTPAINARLHSPILEIDGEKITSHEKLGEVLGIHKPGETILVKTLTADGEKIDEVILAERDGKAFLGIGFFGGSRTGFSGLMFSAISKIRDPVIHYEPVWNPDLAQFIYDLLWWIVVINILVALFNMLPVSILDGGRFFYLTIWGITRNEKIGKKAYSIATWFILALLVVMMARWLLIFVT